MTINADQNSMNKNYLWVIPIAVLFPLLQIVIFAARFGRLTQEIIGESSVFLPMGLIAGAVLIYLLERVNSRIGKILTIAGFVIASPLALIGALMSGLMLPPLIGATLYGAIPLIVGSLIGYFIGKRWN